MYYAKSPRRRGILGAALLFVALGVVIVIVRALPARHYDFTSRVVPAPLASSTVAYTFAAREILEETESAALSSSPYFILGLGWIIRIEKNQPNPQQLK